MYKNVCIFFDPKMEISFQFNQVLILRLVTVLKVILAYRSFLAYYGLGPADRRIE